MRRFCFFGMALFLFAATARAEEAADQLTLVLNSAGHTAPVTDVLFTADGKEIVTTSQDKTVRRWDAGTGERLAAYYFPAAPGDDGRLQEAALSPDGKTLAVGGVGYRVDGKRFSRVYLLDLSAGRVTAALPGPGFIAGLAFSHDGKLLAAGGGDQAMLLDVASGQVVHSLKSESVQGVVRLAFSPDDKLLALASVSGGMASLWSVETGGETCPAMKHKFDVWCLAWKDDDTLAAGDSSGEIVFWDRRGKQKKRFEAPAGGRGCITALSFLPNGEGLFYSYYTDENKGRSRKSGGGVIDLARPDKSRVGYAAEGPAIHTRGAVSPDGRLAAVEDGFGVNLWTVMDGKPVRRLAGRGRTPYGAGWGPDGRTVGWGNGADGALQRAFDLGALHFTAKPDGKFVRAALTQKSPALGELRVDPSGRPTLKIVSNDPKHGVLSTINAKDMHAAINNYTFLPGDRLAVGLGSKVWVYAASTGKLIRVLEGPICDKNWDLAPSPAGRYLLAACNDETLRIWDPDKPQPLLSLFVAGADWVAWTEQGYYAASPAGERLMGWQVNNGLEQLGAFHPAAEFHRAFYRPDVISRVLKEGSVAKALEAADKANGTTTQAVDVAQALPPEVTILAPVAGKLDQAEVEVKAEAVSKDRLVLSLRLLLDGRPYPGAEVKKFPAAKAGDKQEATWAVKKPEGDHVLSVLAESDVSSAASKEVAVAYRPAAAPEPLPTLYVVAVGINAYPGSLKLNWAVEDAAAIAKAFQADSAPKPFGKVDVKLLLDKDATREGILGGLDSLKGMTTDDTAVVFYAGHGHRDKKTGQFYMLPFDVDVTDLPKTGVTGTEIKKRLQAAQGRVLVLLDACHSGSIGQSPIDSNTDDVQRQLAGPDCGAVIMCAAMAQEEAGEAAAVKHGFFTAALLSGLGGAAPPSKDGFIHLTALNFYVEEQVSELSKDEQHVVVDRPSTVTSFPLVKPPAKAEQK